MRGVVPVVPGVGHRRGTTPSAAGRVVAATKPEASKFRAMSRRSSAEERAENEKTLADAEAGKEAVEQVHCC